jgi:hypothetical protein
MFGSDKQQKPPDIPGGFLLQNGRRNGIVKPKEAVL